MGAFNLPMLMAFGLGYLLGSIPFGLLLTRAAGLGDIRNTGSGNIGATNVLRTGNKKLAAATLLLDGLKGTVAVLLAAWLFTQGPLAGSISGTSVEEIFEQLHRRQSLAVAAGLGAFIGHIYPVWLGFKGGKGVATYIGVLFGLAWPAGVAFCVVWLASAAVTRISSLSALVASIVTPVLVYVMGAKSLAIMLAPMTVLLLYKHAANISRLLKGEEPRIGAKS